MASIYQAGSIFRNRLCLSVSIFAFTIFSSSAAFAQAETGAGAARPIAEATYIATADAPIIDGVLDDAVWQRGKPIEDFYVVQPVEGATPSEKTSAVILYDDHNLYVAFKLYDSDISELRTETLERDPDIGLNDGIRIVLDPFQTGRDSYYFGVNSGGAKLDGLSENNNKFLGSWNTIWDAKVAKQDDGWSIEVAIPFRSISYEAGRDQWNINLIRTIRRTNENLRWSNVDRTKGSTDISEAGYLNGMGEIKTQGKGFEAQLYGTAVAGYDWETGQTDSSLDPSANLYYRFTPGLTGTVTLNTDFSDTPLDSRQVNTGRFSLFFPETRDFFLQDSAVFSVANRIFGNPNGQPFFSRRIGIVNGEQADIIAGAKLSGRIGDINLGGLVTQTDATNSYEGQTLSVVRASIPVFEGARLGGVITHGDPTGETENTVVGLDFDYQKNNIGDLSGTLYAVATAIQSNTQSDSIDESGAFVAGELSYRSSRWNWTLRGRDIEDTYDPALGFLSRGGIRSFNPFIFRAFQPKDSAVEQYETGFWYDTTSDRNGTTLDEAIGGWFNTQFKSTARAELEWNVGNELIDEPFTLAGIIPVDAGRYDGGGISIWATMPQNEKFYLSGFAAYSDTLGGTRTTVSPELNWRPNEHFGLAVEYEYTNFDLPNGELGIHIGGVETKVNVSSTLAVDTEVQYDNISTDFSWLSRLRWEATPYREVFVSFGHAALIDPDRIGEDFRSTGTSLSFRVGQTIRL